MQSAIAQSRTRIELGQLKDRKCSGSRRDEPALLGPTKLTAAGSSNPAVAGNSNYPAGCNYSRVGCRSRGPNSTSLSRRGHNRARTAQRRNLPT